MVANKLKKLVSSLNDVKEKVQETLQERHSEQKKKVTDMALKAKKEINKVFDKEVAPLLKEGKKEVEKLQKNLEKKIHVLCTEVDQRFGGQNKKSPASKKAKKASPRRKKASN